MNKAIMSALAAVLCLNFAGCDRAAELVTDKHLGGRAEDLWGETVNLSDYRSGLTILHPLSPCNCGYCLFDDEFIYRNYGLNTIERGGAFFGISLFASQLDDYAYEKHYRGSYDVITWPPALHRYHRDGFPWICAFKDGDRIYSGALSPYERHFDELRNVLWGEEVPLVPTSDMHMATRFVSENKSRLGVLVVPDGKTVAEGSSTEAYTVKSESDLSEEDMRKNLRVSGRSNELKLEFLKGETIPVEITPTTVGMGDYEFPREKVGLNACFPNPHNRERYVVLQILGSEVPTDYYQNWTDYSVYAAGPDSVPKVLLCGLFDKEGPAWKFSRARAWVSDETASFCGGGKCPAPVLGAPAAEHAPYRAPTPRHEPVAGGDLWTLGESRCRFPSVCADGRGGCVVAWEEGGDIIAASLSRDADVQVLPIEDGAADSFNPLGCVGEKDTWVFYLCDRDGFYRLYGSYGRLGGPLNEVRISGEGAADCVTPAVVPVGPAEVVVAWSEWRSNERHLQYRRIDGRMLGDIQDVEIKKSDIDYTNAWYPSLAADGSGGVWGAWNQHYPITLGVFAGNLTEEASAVSDKMGAYPSIVVDRDGVRWAFWESFMWDVLDGRPQRVLAAHSDGDLGSWSLPDDVSSPAGCKYNRIPKTAVDGEGRLWVAWNGRADDTSPWGVYVSRRTESGWSEPLRVSPEGQSARAPSVCAGADGALWLAWHAGTGSAMKVKVLRYEPDGGLS